MHESARGSIHVRRVLSGTPLTRLHERAVDGSRGRKAIPWRDFQRSTYGEAALALAKDQAERLAEGEYGAVGLFGEIVSGLAMTGAPFDVVSAATTVSSDEIRHADYCVRFAELCAGETLTLTIDRDAVEEACADLDTPEEVDFFLLKYSAVGEALAAALLLECRDGAKDAVARRLYGSLLADEVHHARLGWYYFAWRAEQWSQAERQRLADRIAEFVIGIERRFWVGRDAPAAESAMAKALGVLDTERQRAAIAQVMEEEIVPGLDAIGLGGSHAWRVRRRGGETRRTAPSFVITSDAVPAVNAREAPVAREGSTAATDLAATWLASAVDGAGNVRFGLNPGSGEREVHGLMHHGRAALLVCALSAHGGHEAALLRARRRLERDIAAALDGTRLASFPEQPALVAATLALAELAGVDCRRALLERAQRLDDFRGQAWQAAQVVTALGADAPRELWALCVQDLDHSPWAPWTARAALARDEREVYDRCARELRRTLEPLGPDGTVRELPAPAIALVAASVEALAAGSNATPCDEIDRAREYLLRWQFRAPCPPGVHTELADGAFPLSPEDSFLRTDVTAHALLALLATAS